MPGQSAFTAIPGLTYRRLDHWTRTGYLTCDKVNPGSGRPRTWPDEELAVATVMARLIEAGLTVEAAERAARNHGLIAPGITVHVDSDWGVPE